MAIIKCKDIRKTDKTTERYSETRETPIAYDLKSIKAMLDQTRAKALTYDAPRYQGTDIPPRERHVVARAQFRASTYKAKHIEPRQLDLDAMNALDHPIHLLLVEGDMDARDMQAQNEHSKMLTKRGLKEHWQQFKLLKNSPLEEGLTSGEIARCFGWSCSRLETMKGVTRDTNGRLDFNTIRPEHWEAILEEIQEELDRERGDAEPPEYTEKLDAGFNEEQRRTAHSKVEDPADHSPDHGDELAAVYKGQDQDAAKFWAQHG